MAVVQCYVVGRLMAPFWQAWGPPGSFFFTVLLASLCLKLFHRPLSKPMLEPFPFLPATRPPCFSACVYLMWSPSGSYLAVLQEESSEVVIWNRNSKKTVVVDTGTKHLTCCAWSENQEVWFGPFHCYGCDMPRFKLAWCSWLLVP